MRCGGPRWSRAGGVVSLGLIAPLLLASGVERAAAQAPPPHEAYSTLHTENFRVTFPRGLDEIAVRAAERAERAHAELSRGAWPPPAGPVDILLTDHVDVSNGFASVAPSNRIVVWLAPPVDGLGLSHFDEWLDLVITHEVVHIFHLDYVGTPGRIARAVFGRAPRQWPFFLGSALPTLAIEGFAVQQESALTGGGRLHGTFQEAAIRVHAREGGIESVDQALGSTPLWPGGNRPYAYGSLFFHHLATRYGDEAVTDFLRTMAGQWIPFRLDAAARRSFGRSFTTLWEEWRREVAHQAAEEAPVGGTGPPEELTVEGRMALHPAPHPGGDGSVAYSRSDGRSDPRLAVLGPDGRERWAVRWNGSTRPAWTPEGDLVAPQLEFEGLYRVRSDLYRVSPAGGVTRLTRGMRVSSVDVHPEDGRLAAVLEGDGTNRLAVLSPGGELRDVLREADPHVHWSYPRWSPDGRRIAVARWRSGGWTTIQVLGEDGTLLATLDEDRSLHTAPAWSPDGRTLLWASDRSGMMRVYARELLESANGGGWALGELRQVTNSPAPSHFPAVSPDGRWLHLSVLRRTGWELARVPFEPSEWSDPLPLDRRFDNGVHRLDDPADARITAPVAPYSALPTLRPRYWLPVHRAPRSVAGVEALPRAGGFETSATDLLGRHAWAVEATTALRRPGRRLEAAGRYAWAGLGNPVLFVEGSRHASTPFLLVAEAEEGATPDSLVHTARETSFGGGLELRHQRMRRGARLALSGRLVSRERALREMDLSVSERYRLVRPSGDLVEGRISLAAGTARAFPFSVSTQEGLSAQVTVRERWELALPDSLREVTGVDGALRDVLVSVTGYRGLPGPGFARHVVAVRGAAGTARGPGAGSRHFGIGGGGGGGDGPLGFTYDEARSAFPVRGFPIGTLRGDAAWGASVEWRFPLAILHRGVRAWPLHLDRLSGSLFVDGAAVRTRDATGAGWSRLSSAGIELGLVRSFLFESPTLLRGGVAVPLEGPGRSSVYLGFGWGF